LADVGEDALRLALERIAEAATARVGEAEHVAGTERDVARIQAERPDGARVLELEPGAGSRIAAEEAGERDRAAHAERSPLEPRRLAVHGERGVDARSAAEAAGAAGVAPEPLVEVTDRICLLDRLDVGVDESRPAVVAARHVDAVAVPRAAGADGVPVHDEEGGRAVPRRQPEARGPAGRGDTLGEATAAERAGDRLL